MSKKDKPNVSHEMKVTELRNGAVIDHLRRGTAMKVIEVLGITDGSTLSIGMYFESKKMGKKDIVKIENRSLTKDEMSKIALISPEATVCIVRDYEIVEKIKVELPRQVEGIIRCSNPKCITNHEAIVTRFSVENEEPLKVRCHYCERSLYGDEIELI